MRQICNTLFVPNSGGSRSRVHGIGLDHAFQFAIDVGGTFNINKNLLPEQEYFFRVTPPNQFAIGRLADDSSTSHRYKVGEPKFDSMIKVGDLSP